MDEVEPIILDSTIMKKKLVTAIDTVCKVLMEVRLWVGDISWGNYEQQINFS